MPLRFQAVVVDCADAARVGAFWSALLGQPLGGPDDEGNLWIERADANPELTFVRVPESKAVKNRVHIDLRPDEQEAEVERALSLGARHVDIGQRDVSWVVLVDPEGKSSASCAPGRRTTAERRRRRRRTWQAKLSGGLGMCR